MNDTSSRHERFDQISIPILMYTGIAFRAFLVSVTVFLVIGKLVSALTGAVAAIVSFVAVASHFVRTVRPGSPFGSGQLLGWVEVSPGLVEYEWLVESGGRIGRTKIDWSDVERFELPTRPMGTLVVHRRNGASELHSLPLDGRRVRDVRRSIERMQDARRRRGADA